MTKRFIMVLFIAFVLMIFGFVLAKRLSNHPIQSPTGDSESLLQKLTEEMEKNRGSDFETVPNDEVFPKQ